MVSGRLFSRVRDRVARERRKYRLQVQKLPVRALLEPTNSCNLNCPFCLVGQQNKLLPLYGNAAHHLQSRPMGVLSEGTFDSARRELKAFGIREILFYFQGEPLIHRDFVRFTRVLKHDGFWVGTFTNGLLFNDRNIPALIETGIDLIRFSVDGATHDTYVLNRVGGRFDLVYENMRKVASRARGTPTRVEWQYIALRNNEQEIPLARQLASDIGIDFFVKPFRITDGHLVPQDSQYRGSLLEKPCTDIHLQLVICWNGDVVPCCYDVEGEEIMGNINDSSLQTIWTSGKYQAFRHRVEDSRNHPENEPAICRNCLRWGHAAASKSSGVHDDKLSTV
jgi:radical SAM protein with 4Fe4S-binding SPASM domain